MLSPEEAFQFDLQGYLVLRGALDPDQVRQVAGRVAALDNAKGSDLPWSIPVWTPVINEFRILNILDPVREALALVDCEPILQRVRALMDPGLRLVEAYSITRGAGIGLYLHHIPSPKANYRVEDGQPRCTYIKVNVPLGDCGPKDGPFCVIEGSHKLQASFPFSKHDADWPPVVKDRVIMDMMVGYQEGRPEVAWDQIPGYKELCTEVGDVVIFTETLIHGARSSAGKNRRRGLYFGYGLGSCANWHGVQYSPELLEQASDRQRSLIEGPYVGFRYATAPERFALPEHELYPFCPNSEHPVLE